MWLFIIVAQDLDSLPVSCAGGKEKGYFFSTHTQEPGNEATHDYDKGLLDDKYKVIDRN